MEATTFVYDMKRIKYMTLARDKPRGTLSKIKRVSNENSVCYQRKPMIAENSVNRNTLLPALR